MSAATTKLSHQIIVLCVVLVLITSLSVLASFWWISSRYTNDNIQSSVNSATNVFEQYSQTKSNLLTTSAEVLTADFGFKQAIATKDEATIASVLENHSERINADLMLITNRNGDIIASSHSKVTQSPALVSVVRTMLKNTGKTVFIDIDNKLYQVVALPVMAPVTIAFAVFGFEISSAVTLQLKELTGLEISFYNDATMLVSSLKNIDDDVHSHLNAQQRSWGFWLRPQYTNTSKDITSVGDQTIRVLLSNDLSPIYKNFDRLLLTTILLAAAIIVLALLASILFANSLTIPLARLVKGVHQFAQGNYDANVNLKGASSEIQTLISAFDHMGQEIQQREKHILYQAQHDLLTGLGNRDSLLQKIDQAIVLKTPFVLLGLYLRDLQGINDNLGFDTGDYCLQTIAKRLETSLTDRNAIHGRIGADLFLSLIPVTTLPLTDALLTQMQDQLQMPVVSNTLSLNVRLNIGVCRYPEDGDTGKTLVRRTQIAVDTARKENCPIRFYQGGEDEAHLERLAIIEDLKAALNSDDGQLYMNYQPKENLKTGKIEKLEALIRWQRPNIGFVPPDLFIDLAERAGLIIELTQWVFNTVLKQLAYWQGEGINIQVAINISAQDLNHPDFFKNLQATALRHAVSSQWITIELTERDLMSNETQGISLMQQLRNAGYTLSVDDYGIGQSSLGKLKQLPVHELKIDKSFILKLDQSPTDQMIVRSTIDLGHNLGLSVVAEGVENLESKQLLRDMNCDYIQGYHLAKPLPAEQVKAWLSEREAIRKQA